jgi:2-keto-4-pentenoate hydratase/2-oxohepta-3-ene-1,7-dioic acid hydratase in catechol pathway
MRLVSYQLKTPLGPQRRAGALVPEGVVDLASARVALLDGRGRPRAAVIGEAEVPSDLLEFLRGGEFALDAAREAVEYVTTQGLDEFQGRTVLSAAGDVRLLAPLPRPNSLRDFLVFEEHLVNGLRRAGRPPELPPDWYRLPAHYKGNPDAIYGPDDLVPYPAYTNKLDYELEICAVVGRPGRRIAAAEAGAHIVGYTLYNDWSARDIQRREQSVGIGPGISKDLGSSIGPCIATPDEFDRAVSTLQARVDGEVWSTGTLANMHFSFEDIIEYISMEAEIQPGDLLGSGTIGNGCGMEMGRYLEPGMTVELEAEGIGILRNRLAPQTEMTVREDWQPTSAP